MKQSKSKAAMIEAAERVFMLLQRINAAVSRFEAISEPDWADVGSINHIESELMDIAAFLEIEPEPIPATKGGA